MTRAARVAAARRLFEERGFAAVGTDEIARAAGVTRGALYHQFDGKLELFAAVLPRALHVGVDAWLGWKRWREIGHRYGVGLVEGAVEAAIAGGVMAEQPRSPTCSSEQSRKQCSTQPAPMTAPARPRRCARRCTTSSRP